MSAVLPHDLIKFSSTDADISVYTDSADVEYERQQILHTFWNVHVVRHKVSRHISDARSCNLFWRVWSSSKLSQSISTIALTALWDRCRSEQNLSPPQRPVSSVPETDDRSQTSNSSPTVSLRGQPRRLSERQGHGSEIANQARRGVRPDSLRATASSLQIEPSSLSQRELEENTVARPRLSRGGFSRGNIGRTSMIGRDKPVTRGRVRPSLGRRKSSQTGRPSRSSPGPDDEPDGESEAPRTSREGAAAFTLASPSSWEDEPSTSSSQLSPRDTSPNNAQLVIDKDFRGKFVEKIASSTNIAGIGRMKKTGSVVRFADEQRPSPGRPNESLSTTFEYPSRPTFLHRQSTSSVAISDDDTDTGSHPQLGLQRTTSSLSILLQQAQLDNRPLEQNSDQSRPQKGKEKEENTEEEDMLAMGRRAGSIVLPPRQEFGTESAYSSPEPEPLF